MRTKTIKLYKISELNEEAKEKTIQDYRDNNIEIFWSEEILESLKALFDHCNGVKLKNYSLNTYHSRIDIEFSRDECEDLKGKRAIAWLENNLYNDLRYKAGINHIKERVWLSECVKNSSHKEGAFIHQIGERKDCPFTGVCFDEDFIDSLNNDIKGGMTLKEAFEGLAGEYEKILNNEIEGQNAEDYIVEHMEANNYEFLEDGERA